MVFLVFDKICVYKYRCVYYSASAVCDSRRSGLFRPFAGADHIFADPVFHRTCGGGIYHHHYGDAADRKRDDAEPWDHRVLHREDL